MTQRYITIIVVMAALAISGNSLAQDSDAPGHERGKRMSDQRGPRRGFGDPTMMIERMAEHLELDDAQRQSITNIVDAARPEFEALRDAARENREAIHALDVDDPDYGSALQNLSVTSGELASQLTMLTGWVRGELADILTAEQRALLEERMSRMGERRRHGGGRDRAR